MPDSWQPPAHLQARLNPIPWSRDEANEAAYAVRTGLYEMVGYFKNNAGVVQGLGDDSIEALIQVTYASANDSVFDRWVRNTARGNLGTLTRPFLQRDPSLARCDEFETLLPLAIFAHRLYPASDGRTAAVTAQTNAAFRDCDSLQEATGYDIAQELENNQADTEVLFDLHVWSLWFSEAQLFEEIELPEEARQYAPQLWHFAQSYRFADAGDFKGGADNDAFIGLTDLASHLAHIPTGVNRYRLHVAYLPELYRWHRENFYAVMSLQAPDLFASVVDTLRQYGCTPENDKQVRDGTRYLLRIFREGDDQWMDYRQDHQTVDNVDDYDLIHYPWTGVLGVRARQFEPPEPGTFGATLRSQVGPPR